MRLLLAEDETSLARALTKILEKNRYVVDTVYDGENALQYLLTGDYDVAVLDVMMPKMDGFSVVRQFRSQGGTVPVLLLTAKAEVEDRVTGLDSGADYYLTKPFDSRELLAALRAIPVQRFRWTAGFALEMQHWIGLPLNCPPLRAGSGLPIRNFS